MAQDSASTHDPVHDPIRLDFLPWRKHQLKNGKLTHFDEKKITSSTKNGTT